MGKARQAVSGSARQEYGIIFLAYVSNLIDYRLLFKEYSVYFIILRSIYRYISRIFAFFNINIFTIYKNFQFFLGTFTKSLLQFQIQQNL
jgi:hypothetical protein